MAESDAGVPTEITTPDHLRSDMWKVFGFPSTHRKITNKDIVICRICKVQMKYHLTTSHLKAHLITLHPGKLGEGG